MAQTYSCYITKDINKKSSRKNWVDGRLEYCAETARIRIKNESGSCVAERFDDLVFNNFMKKDIIKVGSFEVEFANSSNNNNDNNGYNENSNSNGNQNNNSFKQTTRKFKHVGAPKFDNTITKRRMNQNNHGYNNRNNHNKPIANNCNKNGNNYKRNGNNANRNVPIMNFPKEVARRLPFGDVAILPKVNNKNNSNRAVKRTFNDMKDGDNNGKNKHVTTTTKTVLSGSILEYIDIDTNALNCNGGIYEKKEYEIFEDLLKTDYKNKDIPTKFRKPYFLPFYDELPQIIYSNVAIEDDSKMDILK